MATWKIDNSGKVGIEFGVSDLVFSNIQNTKNTLSEVLDHSLFKITMNDVQEFDSSGLQLLIYFIGTIKAKGGQVDFESLPPEMTALCSIYGIENMGRLEELSVDLGGSNV